MQRGYMRHFPHMISQLSFTHPIRNSNSLSAMATVDVQWAAAVAPTNAIGDAQPALEPPARLWFWMEHHVMPDAIRL